MGLLGAIGGAIGLVTGGPIGAALGSGIGTLIGGGDLGDALKSGLLGYGIGSIPSVQNLAAAGMGAIGAQGAASSLSQMAQNPNAIGQAVQSLTGAAGNAAGAMTPAAAGAGTVPGAGGLSSLLKFAESPLVLSTALQLMDRQNANIVDEDVLRTGERNPDYRGTPVAAGGRYRPGPTTSIAVPGQSYAMGGYVQGPGTGRSDSIPAQIYQGGRPVEQAALSDGEFVMTNQAVRGAGNGDRRAGAARMYQMMRDFERRA